MFALLIFPGRPGIVLALKNMPVACFRKKKPPTFVGGLMFALLIFPGSRPPSIVSVHELNFCVRDGNRWTLMTINTNFLNGFRPLIKIGDPYRIRTDVNGVRGRCLNHLTNGPFGAASGTRTRDPLIKSQLLYQLS